MTLEAGAAQTPTVTVGGAYDGKIAGLYDLEETLGSGHFAVVKLARHVFTGEKVAVKVVDKTKLDDVSKAHLFQEVRCMKLVQHPNVVRLYEVIDTQTKLYLVLELGDGGDLYDYIMRHESGLSEDLARKYFRQILRAITYCHQLHVVHRDLKPENVVFFEKLGVVKLTDFGFSNKFSPGQKLKTFCGSLAYSAPEILLGDLYDAPAVDIWSLGVILYMLVCGQPPFEKANDSETLTMIMDCKYTVPPYISQHCGNLIASMLVRDPKKRATLAQIANNPWLLTCDETDASSIGESHLPLVSRQQISEEDHTFIIQKMINGNIAPKEEIMQSLDKNKYNHITATYFLLAEMRLRKRREENAEKQRVLDEAAIKTGDGQRSKQVPTKPSIDSIKVILPISINVTPTAQTVNEPKTDKRSRKCSIVREEDEEESANEQSGNGNELKVAVSTRRESISDGRINRSVHERKHSPANARTKIVVSMDSTHTQKSNQIEKHASSVAKMSANQDDDDAAEALRGLKELEIGKLKPLPTSSKNAVLTHRRTKLNKIRTPSCSSSEASDDDTKTRNKKKMNKICADTPTRFRTNRRDSHDDSSDSQDQLHPGGGAQNSSTANLISNSSNVSGKKGNQCKESTTNKNEETRKSHTQKGKKQQNKPEHTERHHMHGGEKQSASSMKIFIYERNSTASRRRRLRESQSLDRCRHQSEAQEYELRYRAQHSFESTKHIESKNSSLINLNTFSVAQIKEEFDEKSTAETVIPNNHNNKNKNNNDTDDDDDENVDEDDDTLDQLKNMNVAKATSKQLSYTNNKNSSNNYANSKSTLNDIYNLNSIADFDLILDDKSLTKAIQVSGSKCFVTIKKIRRIGKYFPVVNFS